MHGSYLYALQLFISMAPVCIATERYDARQCEARGKVIAQRTCGAIPMQPTMQLTMQYIMQHATQRATQHATQHAMQPRSQVGL